jgi:hypothetical protein
MIRSSATHRQHSLKKNLAVDTSLSGSSHPHPHNHQTVLEKKHVIILSTVVIMMIAYVTLVSVLSTSSLLVEAG